MIYLFLLLFTLGVLYLPYFALLVCAYLEKREKEEKKKGQDYFDPYYGMAEDYKEELERWGRVFDKVPKTSSPSSPKTRPRVKGKEVPSRISRKSGGRKKST